MATGVTFQDEPNPFLGIRGYRLLRIRKDIFATQLRALARQAVFGPLKVMNPMVTVRSEMAEFSTIYTDVINSLRIEGTDCAVPSLGVRSKCRPQLWTLTASMQTYFPLDQMTSFNM